MNQDIRDAGNALIEGVTRAWDLLMRQVDDILGWSPGPVPSVRRPSAMADGELRAALRTAAFGLIGSADPAVRVGSPAEGDARWRFNLPMEVRAQVAAMCSEASDAFRLAAGGLDDHASPAALAALRRLADTVAQTRWLLEPSDPGQRRERGYALAAAAIARLEGIGGHAEQAREIADRAATLAARLAELREADGAAEVKVPKRRRLLRGYLPAGAEPFALLAAAGPQPAPTPSALFYREAGTGDPLRDFQRLQLTRAYWLGQAITLYAGLCEAAAPVLGRGDWAERIAAAEPRFRPLCEEASRRYWQRLRRGLHPGL